MTSSALTYELPPGTVPLNHQQPERSWHQHADLEPGEIRRDVIPPEKQQPALHETPMTLFDDEVTRRKRRAQLLEAEIKRKHRTLQARAIEEAHRAQRERNAKRVLADKLKGDLANRSNQPQPVVPASSPPRAAERFIQPGPALQKAPINNHQFDLAGFSQQTSLAEPAPPSYHAAISQKREQLSMGSITAHQAIIHSGYGTSVASSDKNFTPAQGLPTLSYNHYNNADNIMKQHVEVEAPSRHSPASPSVGMTLPVAIQSDAQTVVSTSINDVTEDCLSNRKRKAKPTGLIGIMDRLWANKDKGAESSRSEAHRPLNLSKEMESDLPLDLSIKTKDETSATGSGRRKGRPQQVISDYHDNDSASVER